MSWKVSWTVKSSQEWSWAEKGSIEEMIFHLATAGMAAPDILDLFLVLIKFSGIGISCQFSDKIGDFISSGLTEIYRSKCRKNLILLSGAVKRGLRVQKIWAQSSKRKDRCWDTCTCLFIESESLNRLSCLWWISFSCRLVRAAVMGLLTVVFLSHREIRASWVADRSILVEPVKLKRNG